MRMPTRLCFFLIGAAGLAYLYLKGASQLPPIGHYSGPYGDDANHASVAARHITDSVSGVNFDIRAVDTLGEEFILFTSVIGAVVFLREAYEKETADSAGKRFHEAGHTTQATDAVRFWTLAMTAPTVLFGCYIVLHGQLSPGGGFQGGVILATAPLLIFLSQDYETFKRVTSNTLLELGESLGAGSYAGIGVIALLFGMPFLTNFLPLGQKGELLSGGIIPLISFLVGLEVAGGFVLLLTAFLQHVFASPEKEDSP
ncbi:MAG: MnhB domain-containing protein [Bdellovibrionia bacterium]